MTDSFCKATQRDSSIDGSTGPDRNKNICISLTTELCPALGRKVKGCVEP